MEYLRKILYGASYCLHSFEINISEAREVTEQAGGRHMKSRILTDEERKEHTAESKRKWAEQNKVALIKGGLKL